MIVYKMIKHLFYKKLKTLSQWETVRKAHNRLCQKTFDE